jgi:hypothetical protein
MIVARVYLETRIFNRYFEEDREYHEATKLLFDWIRQNKLIAFTSSYVVEELEAASEHKKSNMLDLIGHYNINMLESDKRTDELANKYIEYGIIPQKYTTDAAHIASASIHCLDAIISLNFRHINKLTTKIKVESINKLY